MMKTTAKKMHFASKISLNLDYYTEWSRVSTLEQIMHANYAIRGVL
ncbi:MAG: hypothetical protein JNL74_11020 [Fibrobacteres bacterium]|nr:hypothetical protein [Fibrobacterota bacterium]